MMYSLLCTRIMAIVVTDSLKISCLGPLCVFLLTATMTVFIVLWCLLSPMFIMVILLFAHFEEMWESWFCQGIGHIDRFQKITRLFLWWFHRSRACPARTSGGERRCVYWRQTGWNSSSVLHVDVWDVSERGIRCSRRKGWLPSASHVSKTRMWKLIFFWNILIFFETSEMPCQIHFYALFCSDVAGAEPEGGMAKKPHAAGTTSRDALCYHSSTAERARGTECHWFCSGGGGTNGLEGGRFFLRWNVEIGMFFLQHASQLQIWLRTVLGKTGWFVWLGNLWKESSTDTGKIRMVHIMYFCWLLGSFC